MDALISREKLLKAIGKAQVDNTNSTLSFGLMEAHHIILTQEVIPFTGMLKERAAQNVIGVLIKIRNELWEDAKQYLKEHTSEEKPLLTDGEDYMYKARAELVVEMGKAIEIVKDYYKTKINGHSEGQNDNTEKD